MPVGDLKRDSWNIQNWQNEIDQPVKEELNWQWEKEEGNCTPLSNGDGADHGEEVRDGGELAGLQEVLPCPGNGMANV